MNCVNCTEWTHQELVQLLQIEYGLNIVKTHKMDSGWENSTFIVTDCKNSKFVFRISEDTNKKTLPYLNFEMDILNILSKYNLPVSNVIPNLENKRHILVKDKIAMLMIFLEGNLFTWKEKLSMSREQRVFQIKEIARFLGSLHKISGKIDVKPFKENESRQFQGIGHLKNFFYPKVVKLGNRFDHVALIRNLPTLDQLDRFYPHNYLELDSKMPSGIIHLDLHDQNSLFVIKDGYHHLNGVLDWDDSQYGPFLYDIAISFSFWCSEKEPCDKCNNTMCHHCQFNLSPEMISVFLEEYTFSRGYALTREEIQMFPIYFVYILLVQCEFIVTCNPEERLEEQSTYIREFVCYLQQLDKIQRLISNIQGVDQGFDNTNINE